MEYWVSLASHRFLVHIATGHYMPLIHNKVIRGEKPATFGQAMKISKLHTLCICNNGDE